jgi:type II restriction enzyme
MSVIEPFAVENRKYWIGEIENLSGVFGDDSDRVESELSDEIKSGGLGSLLNHLRLCGDIPESYGHDSSEEKLYSKYTDAILNESYKYIGLKSLVLRERGDSADVEAFSKKYSFVADAKAFRLSRTAKNQKDFKVQAMDGWKRGKPYAMVVCPIYQLPTRASQIYHQASTRNVCIFTYSHLSVLCSLSEMSGTDSAQELLLSIFDTVKSLSPSKDSSAYWLAINRCMLGYDKRLDDIWKTEKIASVDSVKIAKEVALTYLATERERIMRMSHEDALKELLKINRIESRIQTIKSVQDTGLLNLK